MWPLLPSIYFCQVWPPPLLLSLHPFLPPLSPTVSLVEWGAVSDKSFHTHCDWLKSIHAMTNSKTHLPWLTHEDSDWLTQEHLLATALKVVCFLFWYSEVTFDFLEMAWGDLHLCGVLKMALIVAGVLITFLDIFLFFFRSPSEKESHLVSHFSAVQGVAHSRLDFASFALIIWKFDIKTHKDITCAFCCVVFAIIHEQ